MEKSLSNLREKAKNFYHTVKAVYCPYFGEDVIFRSDGLKHIQYRGKHKRHVNVQKMRYKLLHFAPRLIKKTNTLQEYERKKLFVEVKMNKRKVKQFKEVRFFDFIAIIDDWKIKVIVRQIGNGKKHFWSIIPNWKTRKSKDGKKIYQNHTGSMKDD